MSVPSYSHPSAPPSRGQSPLGRSLYGFKTYIRGVQWLMAHKRYLFLSFLPTLVGLVLLGLGWGAFLASAHDVVDWMLFTKPDEWYWLALYSVLYGLTFLTVMGGILLFSLLLVNVLAAPLYDMVSVAIERDILGQAESISTWESLKLVGEELKKVLFVFAISLMGFLLTFWLPFLNLLILFVTAFMIGWDFYDFALARRGWSFQQRFRFVRKDAIAVTSFGFWLLIPFVQFLLIPLASAGGTLLALEGLMEHQPDGVHRRPHSATPTSSPTAAPSSH